MLAGLICTAAQIKDPSGRILTQADFMPWAKENDPMEDSVESIAQLMKVKG